MALVDRNLGELWRVVASIPPGRVASYGEVGRALARPASGFLVGRWMAQAPEWVAWWRVVAKTGMLATVKRDPCLGREQRRLLCAEGVEFDCKRVAAAAFWTP